LECPKDPASFIFYHNILRPYIPKTGDFYSRKLVEWMKISVPDFLKIATIYLKEEELRVQQYHKEFRIKVREAVVDSVLCRYITSRNDDSGIF